MHPHPRQNNTFTGLSGGYEALFAAPHRFSFNGKESDSEVKGEGNGLDFGARMYDSRLGRWMSSDPFEGKYPFFSTFNFAANNPIYIVDYDGRDIRIFDNCGNHIATIKVPTEGTVTLPSCIGDYLPEIPLEINPSLFMLNGAKPDAVGVGVEGSFTFGGGMNGGFEFVYFLQGPEKNTYKFYNKIGANIGFEGGVGIYGLVAKNQAGTENVSGKSWEGIFNFYQGGAGILSGGYFWGTENSQVELYPGMSGDKMTWWGINTGLAKGQEGVKWGVSDYSLNETLNDAFPSHPQEYIDAPISTPPIDNVPNTETNVG